VTDLGAVLRALAAAGQLREVPEGLPRITSISDDSRRVEPGALFCAVEGTAVDGHRFVADAAARGAAAALVTRRVEAALPQILVGNGRSAASIAAREWYGHPADGLRIVGVTGTNGKTTTVALIRHLLNAEGTVACVGTLGAQDGAGRFLEGRDTLTTPGTIELHNVLAELKERGTEAVVMEASSHALDQRRLETLRLAAAVYTNLTHEHLDYHGDLQRYRRAKLTLSELLEAGGVEVVNRDEEAWRHLPEREGIRRVWWGRGSAVGAGADAVVLGATGSRFTLALGGERVAVELPLLGDFNVANALAAAATAWALGASPATVARRLAEAPQVAGRMERLYAGDFVVLRDYAHTPDALERALAALRPLTQGRLVVLFGAGGDRDQSKRPLMGRVAAAGADLAVVTSDNPRTEDPDRIIDEIEAGMGEGSHLRITDRRAAIHQTLARLAPGDVLLLAGKGHETYQVVGTRRVPFDEREIVRDALGGGSGP
jgi:UDP-N-acetylmuramoyl-L-alanyl-D-glutamate--2,6-diaminopimelate ligase